MRLPHYYIRRKRSDSARKLWCCPGLTLTPKDIKDIKDTKDTKIWQDIVLPRNICVVRENVTISDFGLKIFIPQSAIRNPQSKIGLVAAGGRAIDRSGEESNEVIVKEVINEIRSIYLEGPGGGG